MEAAEKTNYMGIMLIRSKTNATITKSSASSYQIVNAENAVPGNRGARMP